MNALINITTNTQGASVVSARELHEFLEAKDKFAQWFVRRVEKYGLIEGHDYVATGFSQNGEKGGRPETDYALTLDCAKELAMVQNNEKGKEARQYFIQCEKQLRQSPALSQLDILAQSVAILQRQERELAEVKQTQIEQAEQIRQIDARTTTRPDYFTIVGYATLNRLSVNMRMASTLGQAASRICKERNLSMDQCPDPRFGVVNMYPKQVLAEVFNRPL